MKIEKAKQNLIHGIKTYAMETKPEGEFFTLKSGEKSRFYFDLKKLILCPKYLKCIVKLLVNEFKDMSIFEKFGGPSIGADPIIGGLCMHKYFNDNISSGFLIRSEPKEHGKTDRIVGYIAKGDRCVIIEDVVTTGKSTADAIRVVQDAGGKVIGMFSIMNRNETGLYDEDFMDMALNIPYTSLVCMKDLKKEIKP